MARRYYIDTLRNIDGGTMAEGWHTQAKTEACSNSRQRQMIAKGWQQCWPKEIKQQHFPEHMIALSMQGPPRFFKKKNASPLAPNFVWCLFS